MAVTLKTVPPLAGADAMGVAGWNIAKIVHENRMQTQDRFDELSEEKLGMHKTTKDGEGIIRESLDGREAVLEKIRKDRGVIDANTAGVVERLNDSSLKLTTTLVEINRLMSGGSTADIDRIGRLNEAVVTLKASIAREVKDFTGSVDGVKEQEALADGLRNKPVKVETPVVVKESGGAGLGKLMQGFFGGVALGLSGLCQASSVRPWWRERV